MLQRASVENTESEIQPLRKMKCMMRMTGRPLRSYWRQHLHGKIELIKKILFNGKTFEEDGYNQIDISIARKIKIN